MKHRRNSRSRRRVTLALAGALVVGVTACTTPATNNDDGLGNVDDDPGKCKVVDIASSPEKLELLTDLARTFNKSSAAKVDNDCIFVRVQRKSSGAAEQLLDRGWDEAAEGPRPVIWSPASSAWGSVLNQRLRDRGEAPIANDATPFMLTPLVIALPRPMATALGWPGKAIGFSDVLALAREQKGWSAFGHPEWGPFRLGKTNPNFSTSGLSALVAQTYAANGKTSGLSLEDLDKPQTLDFARGVESAVVHYGDTTLTFLNNWYRADQRGNPYQYVSAVAVEEKSVLDYNAGNPDGIVEQGEEPRKPRVPLVAIYPKEGTLYSDNPLIVLDGDWVDSIEKRGAKLFVDFVQQPQNQRRVLDYGFRPGNPAVAIGSPIIAANGVDPDQPKTLLRVPDSKVLSQLIDDWEQQRKPARVTIVIDISGSMGAVGNEDTNETKLDLAKEAAIAALDEFGDEDEVGLWVFSTGLGDQGRDDILRLIPPSRVGTVRESLKVRIGDLAPTNGTPLYQVTQEAYETMAKEFDPARINAVVLLSDGQNDDGNRDDDRAQLDSLLRALTKGTEGQTTRPVRIFPIAYGGDADLPVLRRIAEATSSAVYDSSDPTSITKVFAAVVSNF
jgi:Ca-activated chloride channel family protein